MAGSAMVLTYDDGQDGIGLHCGVRQAIATWTSDSSAGTASGATRKISGRLLKIQAIQGSPTPSSGYSITITDANGFNVLGSSKSNLSSVNSGSNLELYPFLLDADSTQLSLAALPVVDSILTIAIASAGNSKQGTIIIFYSPL